MNDNSYTPDYYGALAAGSQRSAEVIVPMIIDMFRPRSVVDVGCGVGTWLSVFKAHGVEDVFGIDREYVDRRMLAIPPEEFFAFDLREPLRLDRRFDVALSVEVAEHIPHECADTFVETLVRLAPVVIFSAAIPFQGGLLHLNEQWPEYWSTRFRKHGFTGFDPLRRKIWQHAAVDWWYAQNIFVCVHRDRVNEFPALAGERPEIPPLVHPKNYEQRAYEREIARSESAFLADPKNYSPRTVIREAPRLALKILQRGFQKIRHPSRTR